MQIEELIPTPKPVKIRAATSIQKEFAKAIIIGPNIKKIFCNVCAPREPILLYTGLARSAPTHPLNNIHDTRMPFFQSVKNPAFF